MALVIVPVLLTFVAVFLLVASAYLGVMAIRESPTYALKMRLKKLALSKTGGNALSDSLRSDLLKETTQLERTLNSFSLFRIIDRWIEQAGFKIQSHILIIFSFTGILITSIGVYLFFRQALFSLLAATVLLLLLTTFVQFKRSAREKKFTEQLPDILMMIARSLRAGHSMNSAIELVGLESPNPAGELFKTAYDQQKLGMSVIDSLANMTSSIESLDLRFFITTVSINAEIGGNLAEILDKLAETIRDRGKIRRQVQVYTAQGRYSGYILGVLPIVMFIMINLLNPEYGKILIKERLGNYFLMGAFCMQVIGFIFIRKIVNIRI